MAIRLGGVPTGVIRPPIEAPYASTSRKPLVYRRPAVATDSPTDDNTPSAMG